MKSLLGALSAFVLGILVTIAGVSLRSIDISPRGERIGDSSPELHKLFQDYWEFALRDSPSMATSIGRSEYNDPKCHDTWPRQRRPQGAAIERA